MSMKLWLIAVIALVIAATGAGWKWDKHKSAESVPSGWVSTVAY